MGNNARLIVAAFSWFGMGSLWSDEFHPILSVSSSTQETDFYPVSRLAQGPGVGFDAAEPHDGVSNNANFLWVTDACGYPCDYFETFSAPVLTFDLGEDRPLHEISLWSYTNDNSGKEFSLRFATESDGLSGFGTSITYSPRFSAGTVDPTPRRSYAFGRRFSARYVELTVLDNHFQGDGTAGGDRVGLTEVAFAVPPSIKERLVVTAPRAFEAVAGQQDLSGLNAIPFTLGGASIVENYWSTALHQATGDVYLSVPTEGRIYRGNLNDDPPVLEEFVFRNGAVYHGLAVDEVNGLLYALDSADDAIHLYSMALGIYFGAVGGVELQRPNELLFDRKRQWLVVSDSGLDVIRIYSPGGVGLLYELDSATTVGVWGLAMDEEGRILYSSHDLGEIWRWDPLDETSEPELIRSGLSGPRGLGYDRNGNFFCVESGLGQVRRIGEGDDLVFSTALGGRDVLLYADCDFNGNFLPDEWEGSQSDPALARTLDFDSNYDGDALSDGLEAALGGDFTSTSDGNGVEFMVSDEGVIELEHLALKKSDYRYRVMLSQDLENWHEASVLPEVANGGLLYDTWVFRIDVLEEGFATGVRLFARVEVSLQN